MKVVDYYIAIKGWAFDLETHPSDHHQQYKYSLDALAFYLSRIRKQVFELPLSQDPTCLVLSYILQVQRPMVENDTYSRAMNQVIAKSNFNIRIRIDCPDQIENNLLIQGTTLTKRQLD